MAYVESPDLKEGSGNDFDVKKRVFRKKFRGFSINFPLILSLKSLSPDNVQIEVVLMGPGGMTKISRSYSFRSDPRKVIANIKRDLYHLLPIITYQGKSYVVEQCILPANQFALRSLDTGVKDFYRYPNALLFLLKLRSGKMTETEAGEIFFKNAQFLESEKPKQKPLYPETKDESTE